MRRYEENPSAAIREVSRRLVAEAVRDLFVRLCREISLFPGRVEIEVTPFEVRFLDPPAFAASVAPFRDLFRVSIEYPRHCDVRVSDTEGYTAALDLALKSFLDSRATAQPPILPLGENGGGVRPTAGGSAPPELDS